MRRRWSTLCYPALGLGARILLLERAPCQAVCSRSCRSQFESTIPKASKRNVDQAVVIPKRLHRSWISAADPPQQKALPYPNGYSQRPVEFDDPSKVEPSDEICKGGLPDTHQLIAMYRALVL